METAKPFENGLAGTLANAGHAQSEAQFACHARGTCRSGEKKKNRFYINALQQGVQSGAGKITRGRGTDEAHHAADACLMRDG